MDEQPKLEVRVHWEFKLTVRQFRSISRCTLNLPD